MKILLFLISFFMTVSFCDAQTIIDKSIELKDSSFVKTVTFDINKGTTEINCSVKSFLSGGDLSFVIYDPEGKREGGFVLDATEDGIPGSGRMTHHIKLPLPGRWEYQIKTNKATGNLSFKIYYN